MIDSKFPRVSRALLSILAHLNSCSFGALYSSLYFQAFINSFPFINPLVSVPVALIIIGANVIFMFLSFFQLPSKVEVFILFFTFFKFYSVVSRDTKVHNFSSSLFLLLIIIRSSRLVKIKWSVCLSKSQLSLCVSFSMTDVCCSYDQI